MGDRTAADLDACCSRRHAHLDRSYGWVMRHASGPDESARSIEERTARTDPGEAARVILRRVERGKARVLVGPDARGLMW
ncbi:hypothetical protein ACH47B_31750 [Rhodococcus sp. NPDC019627]|uniref:hypothetical protein n=1 Tax=unclassified Rhodococcus (in: high G+C Gram-positive bacteria) TaxID=192944 RepID=UPI0034006B45